MNLKSTYKMIGKLNYAESVTVTELRADKNIIEQHRKRLTELMPNEKPEQIEKRVFDIVLRDNAFGLIMTNVAKSFEFNIDAADVERVSNQLKQVYKTLPDEQIKMIANHVIQRDLVFIELGKLWDIFVTDDEVKQGLNEYYKTTNEPIRDYLNDKEKFEGIRNLIYSEKIVKEILNRFPVKVDLKKPENTEAVKPA